MGTFPVVLALVAAVNPCLGLYTVYANFHPSYCICPTVLDPVCGVDGVQYENLCQARCAGTQLDCAGKCPCEDKPEGCISLCFPLYTPSEPPPPPPPPHECEDEDGQGGIVDDEEDALVQGACRQNKNRVVAPLPPPPARVVFRRLLRHESPLGSFLPQPPLRGPPREFCYQVCDALHHPPISPAQILG